jgi:hypothetical protein
MPIGISLRLPHEGVVTPSIEAAVETLVRVNTEYLRTHPDTVPLRDAGVRYQREVPGHPEQWQSIPEMLQSRLGDCEDLSAWRCAELRVRGYRARPLVTGKRGHYHIRVAADIAGKLIIYDPSKELGM